MRGSIYLANLLPLYQCNRASHFCTNQNLLLSVALSISFRASLHIKLTTLQCNLSLASLHQTQAELDFPLDFRHVTSCENVNMVKNNTIFSRISIHIKTTNFQFFLHSMQKKSIKVDFSSISFKKAPFEMDNFKDMLLLSCLASLDKKPRT